MNNSLDKSTNAAFQHKVLYCILTDKEFLKENIHFNGDKYFTEHNNYLFDKITEHFVQYKTSPAIDVLKDICDSDNDVRKDPVSKAAIDNSIQAVQGLLQSPPDVAYVKQSFSADVDKQRVRSIIEQAASLMSTDAPETVKQYLTAELSKTKTLEIKPMPKSIADFKEPDTGADPNELIKNRFLCRGGAMMLIGASGIGKSVLQTQLAITWALGQECVGLQPTKAVKSLIVQAEDDDGDICEMFKSIVNGLSIEQNSAEFETIRKNVQVVSLNTASGDKFLSMLDGYLNDTKPDIVWINPILSYLGADASSQRDVSHFLRNGLNPLLTKHNCACVVIHHSAKPPKDSTKNAWSGSDFSYYGLGSVEWSNWARCVLTVVKTNSNDNYILRAAKRGKRLGWKDTVTDEYTCDKYISHSKEPNTLCWKVTSKEDVQTVLTSGNGNISTNTRATILKHIPFAPDCITRAELMTLSGVGDKTVRTCLKCLTAEGKIASNKDGDGKTIVYSKQQETDNQFLN